MLAADREAGGGDTMSTVGEHYNPDRAGADARCRSRWWPGSTASRPGPGFGFALAADYRVVADTASFNTVLRRASR